MSTPTTASSTTRPAATSAAAPRMVDRMMISSPTTIRISGHRSKSAASLSLEMAPVLTSRAMTPAMISTAGQKKVRYGRRTAPVYAVVLLDGRHDLEQPRPLLARGLDQVWTGHCGLRRMTGREIGGRDAAQVVRRDRKQALLESLTGSD